MVVARFRRLLLVATALLVAASSTLSFGSAPASAQSTDSANAAWLRVVYVDTLGRQADDAGLDFWVSRLAGGGSRTREDVVRGFVYSPEGSAVEVVRAYTELLDRQPEAGGAAFWTDYLQHNPVIILRSNLIASDEYFEASGSNNAWLSDIYLEILNRPIDGGGAAYWADQLASGRTRWDVVFSLYVSDEALGQRADDYATEILSRVMTPSERIEAIQLMRAEDERALRAQLLASDEAFEPFLEAVGLLTRAQPTQSRPVAS